MSGEQEEKVFLLAEQIIAALPDRIKVRLVETSCCVEGQALLSTAVYFYFSTAAG